MAGAQVDFVVRASDVADPNPTVSCVPAVGSVFPIGTNAVACTATDAAGNAASANFHITIEVSKHRIYKPAERV
jgi:hypothetical protein